MQLGLLQGTTTAAVHGKPECEIESAMPGQRAEWADRGVCILTAKVQGCAGQTPSCASKTRQGKLNTGPPGASCQLLSPCDRECPSFSPSAVCAQECNLAEVEMPGQHARGGELSADSTVHLERVGCDVAVVRRHGASARRLALYGSDGRTRHFLVQTGQQWSTAAA